MVSFTLVQGSDWALRLPIIKETGIVRNLSGRTTNLRGESQGKRLTKCLRYACFVILAPPRWAGSRRHMLRRRHSSISLCIQTEKYNEGPEIYTVSHHL